MFERDEKFTIKDMELSSETLEELKLADDAGDDVEQDDDSYENVNDDGEFEVGEAIRIEDADEKKPNFDDKGFNKKGFNKAGFNEKGFNDKGFDDKGFNDKGFNVDGKDKDDKPEFDDKGFNKLGFNEKGLNADGFNDKGFNVDKKTVDGRSEKDFTNGYDKDGLDPLGYDSTGKDKDGNTAPSEEPLNGEQPSSTEDALVFSDIVDGKKEISIKTNDGKDLNLKDILDVFKNQSDWNAKNTQNAQVNAKEKSDVEALQQGYEKQNLEFKETLELITKDAKFLEETDEFFDGEKKNPIRKLFETVNANQDSVANRTKADEENATKFEKEANERADNELAQIIAKDSSYNSLTKVQELYKIAEDNQVGLMSAFQLSQTPILEEKLSTIEKTHKDETDGLNKKVTELTEELKKRNEKIQQLEKNPKLIEPDDDIGEAIGSNEEINDNTNDKSFDDVEKRMRKKWGIDKS